MKKIGALIFCIFLFGCSKSPMDRLKEEAVYNRSNAITHDNEMSSADKKYWVQDAMLGKHELKEAVSYCDTQVDRTERCERIYKIDGDCEMDKMYVPGEWLATPRKVNAEHCDNLLAIEKDWIDGKSVR